MSAFGAFKIKLSKAERFQPYYFHQQKRKKGYSLTRMPLFVYGFTKIRKPIGRTDFEEKSPADERRCIKTYTERGYDDLYQNTEARKPVGQTDFVGKPSADDREAYKRTSREETKVVNKN